MTAAQKRFIQALTKLQKRGNLNPSMPLIGATMVPEVSKQRALQIYNELLEAKVIKCHEARLEIVR